MQARSKGAVTLALLLLFHLNSSDSGSATHAHILTLRTAARGEGSKGVGAGGWIALTLKRLRGGFKNMYGETLGEVGQCLNFSRGAADGYVLATVFAVVHTKSESIPQLRLTCAKKNQAAFQRRPLRQTVQ